ncbi:MAG: cobalt ECF transporter T component CbiQ [Thermodesulfobacteriota bacterium]|nr:cobalt ECF transporter T component CbiQ [Thermodesulfobacteriota bacterium]
MMKEPFACGNSWIHDIDPRLRIVSAAFVSVLIALLERFPALWAALAVSIVLAGLARLNPGEVMKRLMTVAGFLILIWLVLPVTVEGNFLYQVGGVSISCQGIGLAARISLKSMAILLVFMALIATMTVSTLGHALNNLRVSGKLVHLMLMTYRYIFVIEAEYRRLRTAMKIRSFRPKTNIHTYRTFAYLIGMLFVRASFRAERVHQAMVCRGFNGRFYTLNDYPSKHHNQSFSFMMIFLVSVLIFLEFLT